MIELLPYILKAIFGDKPEMLTDKHKITSEHKMSHLSGLTIIDNLHAPTQLSHVVVKPPTPTATPISQHTGTPVVTNQFGLNPNTTLVKPPSNILGQR